MFQIKNLDKLSCNYRFFDITSLPAGDDLERNVHLLAKNLAYELQSPVALVKHGDHHCVGLTADANPKLEQPLTPHVAILAPHDEIQRLDFGHLDATTHAIAESFLQYALRRPLMDDKGLWGSGRTFFRKEPLNSADAGREIDIFAGFYHTVVTLDGQGTFLLVDLTNKYADARFLWSALRTET